MKKTQKSKLVNVSGRLYNLIGLSLTELENLIKFIDSEISFHKKEIRKLPRERMESHGIPFVTGLERTRTTVVDFVNNLKTPKESNQND